MGYYKMLRLYRDPGEGDVSGGGGGAGAPAGSMGSGDGVNQQASSGQTGGSGAPKSIEIPAEYKEHGWAKKLEGRTQADLFKHIANQESLLGKKHVVPNLADMSDADRNDYLTQLRGTTKLEDYKFGEGTDKSFAEVVAKSLYDIGIPASMANPMLEKILAKSAELGKAASDKMAAEAEEKVSEAGFIKEMEGIYGKDWKEKSGQTTNLLKGLLSAEDMQAIDKGVASNAEVARMYRLAKAVQDKYGARESGGAGEAGGGTMMDVGARRKEIRAKMRDMKQRPYTQSEYSALQEQLNKTYQ